MKMKKMYFKKFMSVFMACIMLLSCWVWIAPEHAHAVNSSGSYTWRLYISCTNAYTGNAAYYTVTGKTNNGQGTDTTISNQTTLAIGSNSIFDNGTAAYFPSESGTTSTSFPYKVYIHTYKNSGVTFWPGITDGSYSASLQVKKSDGTWVTVCSGDSGLKSGHTDIDLTISNTTNNFPTPTSIEWASENSADTANLTIGKTDNVTRTMKFNVKDQYGVRMSSAALTELSKEPTATVSGSQSGTIGTSTSSNIYYALSSSNTDAYYITVTAKPGAQSTTYDSQTITVGASCNSKSLTNRTFTLYDPTYTFTMNPNGGGMITPTTDISKYYHNTFGYTPDASRTGFSLIGFYTSDYDDSYESSNVPNNESKLISSTYIDSDLTWYAAWQANQYTMKFTYRDENGKLVTSDEVSEYYGRPIPFPELKSPVDEGVDYTHSFTGWSPNHTTVQASNGTVYTAQYDTVTHYAVKTALEEQIRLANEKKAEQEYIDEAYTAESMSAFEKALNAANQVNNNTELLLSMQETVDIATANLKSARENLVPKKFIVIFVDEDGTILKDGYHFVDYGAKVEVPANPVQDPDANYHYTFIGWDTTNSDGLDACNKVITDLRYIAKFDAVPHDFTETVTSSTCTSDGVITKTCDCGYSYTVVNPDDLAGHTWSEDYKVISPATCATKGSEAKYCTACGAIDESTTREIPALGHAWGEYSEYTPATCFGEGTEVSICSLCNGRNVRKTAKLTHSFGPATVVPKTCTTDGYTKEVCSVCGFTNFRDYDIAKGHTLKYETVPETCVSSGYTKTYCENCDFEKTTIYPATGWHEYPTTWETVSEATCVGHGVEKRVCTVCNSATETRLTDIIDHTYPTEWTTEIHATCKGEGYQTKTCVYCGKVVSQNIHALNHNYTTTTETAATCTTAGETVETCSRCGDTNTTVIQPLGHDLDEGVLSSADCTHGGFITYTCQKEDCNHKEYVVLDEATANGHNFEGGTETVIKEATCTEDGEKTVQCANDGCEYKINVIIPKTGHSMKAGTAVPATCTASGYIPYTCDNNCGYTYNVYNEEDPAKGHDFSELVSEKDADCTTDGEEVYKCSRCEATQTTVLPKLGHNYVLESSAEATCTTPATETYKCSACADTYIEYIAPANGHAWGAWTKVQDATADKFGIEKRICSVCQAEEFRTTAPIGDHVFSEEVTVQPGCETEGTKVYTCTEHTDCSANYEETLPATGHKEKLVYEAPTCTKEGSTQIVCETCSKELSEAQTIPVTAHAYGEGEETTAPTCTEDGTMSYTCTACGDTRTEVIAKTGHNLTSVYNPASCEGTGSVVTSCLNANCEYNLPISIPATGHKLTVTVNKATCTTEGSVVEKCDVCGETNTTTLEALGHNYTVDVEGTTIPATCAEDGSKTVKCSRCEATTTVVIPKLGHKWPENWTEIEKATCTEDGEETKTCANCGETITAVIPKKGHNWSEWVKVDATNDTDGSWTRTCSNCNEKETVVIPKGGHIWDNGTVTEEPTCKETGTMVYKCTAHENCGVTLEITLGVVQHTVTTEKKDATCKEGGYVKAYCSVCGTEFKTETTEKAAHTYTAGTPVPATCTTSGYTPYTCSVCGDTYNVYNADEKATGHTLVEGASTATCTAGGVMTLTCACGYSTTVEVPALGHNYVKDENASTEATCAAAATETYKCSHNNCDASYTVSVGEKATEHKWGNWQVKESATADSIGLRTRNCTVCGQLDYEIIPATGSHVFNVKIEDQSKDATCEEDGSVTYDCSTHTGDNDCNLTSTVTLPKTGHKPELQYTPATCTQAGKAEMVCIVEGCGKVLDTKEISALGHAWGNERVTPANCTETGKIEYTCSRTDCSETHETIIKNDFVSHDYITTIMPATCSKEGSIVVKCSRCISSPVNEVIAKLEHAWNDGVIEEGDNATCETDGTKTYTCTANDCGATKTEVIPKTGHAWGEWEVTTPSTNGAEGEMTRICENNAEHTETVKIPAGGHNLVGTVTTPATCTQEGLMTYDCTAHTGENDCGITITVTLDKIQHEITTAIETEATCEEDGKVVTKCANCETATEITVIPATGHNYSGVVTTPATCTTEGVMTYTCAHNEAHQYTTKIAKLQHNYVAGTPVDATCTDSGYTPYKCETCESNYVIITASAKGHTYKEGKSTAECTEGGEMTLNCENCNNSITVDVPALGHDYVINPELSTEATCKDTATETYECSRCEAVYTVSVGSKTNAHEWNEWETVEEATYTSIGYQTRTCKVCDKLEVKTLEKAGDHKLVEVDREDPTCEEDGWIDYECDVHNDCGVTDRVELPATGHTEELYYTAATCTQAGSAKIMCTVCDAELKEKEIPALEHVWGNAQITLSTCQTGGKVEFTCTRANCGEKHTVNLPVNPDAHKLTTKTNPATCKAEGSVVTSCELCGDVLETTPIPMIPHTWGDWEVTKAATNSQPGVMTRRCNNGCTETVEIPAGGHAFGKTPSSIEAATCTKEGTATYNCTAHADCGVTITVKLDKIQHTLKTESKNATCTEEGYVKSYCEVCSEKFADVTLTKLQHVFKPVSTTDPTCTSSGYTTYKCETCNETYNAIGENAKGHTYAEVEGSSTATCTEGGKKTLKCACGDEITVDVPALGHTYTKGEEVAPTCLTSGYTVYECSCGASYNEYDSSKPATDHNWSDWTTTPSTNSEDGKMERYCQNTGCTATETVEIPAGGHAFSEENATVTKDATCTEAGTKVYKCTVHDDCGVTVTVTLPTIAHTLETKVNGATCDKAGSVVTRCVNCEEVNIETEIPALGHAWGNEVVTPATCTDKGSIEYTCTRTDCNATHTVEIPVNSEAHKLTVTVTDATCEEDGSVVTKCTLCGKEEIKTIAKKGHTWKDTPVSTIPATCEAEGSATYDCVNCDKQNAVVIPALGHIYKANKEVAPTCTTSGYTVYVCEHDETHTYNVYDAEKPANGHEWVETSRKNATCTEDGTVFYGCENCAETKTETIAKLGHNWGEWTITTYPTANAEGEKTRECSEGCKETVTLPMLGHDMVIDEEASTAPTCTEDGEDVYVCTTHTGDAACGYTYKVKVSATGHSYDEGKETTAPTCSKDGVKTYTCDCGATRTEVLPKTGHTLTTEVKDATCEETGLVVTSCVNCDEVNIETEIPALGHSFTSTETVTIPATCDVDGEKTVKCSRCDEATTVVIPKLGHDYELTGTTQASCDAPATETYECSRCDSSYVKITAPASGHQYSQAEGSSTATCTEAGEITLKCSACGHEIKTAVPALGHDYELIGTTDATCEAPATETYKCSRCEAAYERTVGETADHSWSEWKTTVEATEGSLGYKERECTVCHKTEVEVIPAIGNHSFTIEIARENVTCETDGYVTYDCAVHTGENDCGLTSTVKAPATGHNEVTTVTDATCTEDGLSVTVCTNDGCGKVIREEIIPATGHDWDEGTVITEATCSTTGVMKYTCKNDSSHTYTQIISSTGHAWDEGVETTQPTCTTAGVRTYTCLTDKTHTYIQLIPVKGHSYGEWIIDKDATCTEDGSKHRVCENDDTHVENAVIPATGHDMGEWVVETAATCTEDGKEISRCANCEHYLEKIVPAKGHLWSEWKITEGDCLSGYTLGRTCVTCSETQSKEVASSEHTYPTDENGNIIYDSVLSPTCTNEGMYYYDCEICGGGDVLITAKTPGFEEELAAKGHKWIISEETDEEGWIITSEATCFKDGMKYRVCENGCGTNCGLDFESKETVIIPAEHLNWVKQGGKAATCTEEGYTEYYLCMDCGYITGRNKIAATGHTDKDNNSKCDTCDTAISSGSSGEIVDCNCLCHETGGFKAFFFKIINFFWRLFRIRPVCDCGKAHY